MSDLVRPFRWDIKRREQLGSLAATEPPPTPPRFEDDLITACAGVLGLAGDSDLVFVGRSPDALFHFLSGALLTTRFANRLSSLNLALRHQWISSEAVDVIEPYFDELELTPYGLLERSRPAALVDVVDTGGTYGDIVTLLHSWCRRDGLDWRAVAARVRLVGVTWRMKAGPKTRRWQQQADWTHLLPRGAIKNVSAPQDFVSYLAAEQPKTTESFTPDAWWDEDVARPLRSPEAREGLALALHLFDLGSSKEGRARLARALADRPAMRDPWFRSLALQLKR